uniref:Uncharacterized protein n=1 Tax=Populus trichocarpa TaxID=3694 RepID=A0A2K1R5M1_POPTR
MTSIYVDDKLYPRSSGLLEEVTKNIQEETEASQMNGVLYKSYGTSMAALKAIGYDFDSDDYHRFVHGRLPFERLKPDHVLRSLLLRLPSNLIQIFSNADQALVAEVLSSSSFEALIIPLITKTSMLVMKLEFDYTSKSQIIDIIEHPCPSNPV